MKESKKVIAVKHHENLYYYLTIDDIYKKFITFSPEGFYEDCETVRKNKIDREIFTEIPNLNLFINFKLLKKYLTLKQGALIIEIEKKYISFYIAGLRIIQKKESVFEEEIDELLIHKELLSSNSLKFFQENINKNFSIINNKYSARFIKFEAPPITEDILNEFEFIESFDINKLVFNQGNYNLYYEGKPFFIEEFLEHKEIKFKEKFYFRIFNAEQKRRKVLEYMENHPEHENKELELILRLVT